MEKGSLDDFNETLERLRVLLESLIANDHAFSGSQRDFLGMLLVDYIKWLKGLGY